MSTRKNRIVGRTNLSRKTKQQEESSEESSSSESITISSIEESNADDETQSLVDVISYLNAEFNRLEKNSPSKGYRVLITYNKENEGYTGELIGVGTRRRGTNIDMPSNTCSFCDSADLFSPDFIDDDIKVVRSLSDRLLLIPEEHIQHWFDVEDDLQEKLILSAISVCSYVERKYRDVLTTEDSYIFEFHVGKSAGQTVSHVHLRVESGDNKGKLTDKQWKRLFK